MHVSLEKKENCDGILTSKLTSRRWWTLSGCRPRRWRSEVKRIQMLSPPLGLSHYLWTLVPQGHWTLKKRERGRLWEKIKIDNHSLSMKSHNNKMCFEMLQYFMDSGPRAARESRKIKRDSISGIAAHTKKNKIKIWHGLALK